MEPVNLKFDSLKIATAVTMVLGILTILSLGIFARIILTVVHKKDLKPVRSSPATTAVHEKESLQKYETLLQNNPFGIVAGSLNHLSAGPVQTAPSAIKLIGTISGRMKHGYAVFLGTDGRQSMIRTGETVPGVGELRTVEKNKVVIKRDGKLTKIRMVDVGVLNDQDIAKGAGAISGPVRLLGKGDFIIDQRAIQFAAENPVQIIMDAKLMPNMVGDRQEGFILREIKKQGIYDNLGFQNGDVLLQINGLNISNPENALQAFTALRGMDRVQLDIVRNNNRMTMNYQIR